jgi:hypothetical protein
VTSIIDLFVFLHSGIESSSSSILSFSSIMATPSPLFFSEDEQYARDLQIALDIQAREERKAQKRQERGNHQESALGDGFSRGALNADHMLFVACTIDQHEVAMLVDTGASTSAMSIEMVHLLGLQPKMNASIYGNAKGVGSSSILGIVEHVSCMIGEDVGFRSFFLVLEGKMPYCILGLDQMRRFNCLVDVGGNVLRFGGMDGVCVPFLPKEQASSVAYCMMYEHDETAVLPPPSNHQQPQQDQRESGGGWGSYFPWGKKGSGGSSRR